MREVSGSASRMTAEPRSGTLRRDAAA